MVSPGQLLERIRDLRLQISSLGTPLKPPLPAFALESPATATPLANPLERPWDHGIAPSQAKPNPRFSWRKTHLVEKGLALTTELKEWQARAESGAPEIETILDPLEFTAIVRVADAALRLIPAFPIDPEILEPLAVALETILQPLWDKIAVWHRRAQGYFDLNQFADTPLESNENGELSAYAATIVRFSQQTGYLGLWLLPWEKVSSTDRTPLVRAWLASMDAFAEGVWAMHKASFEALKMSAPGEGPNPRETWFPLKQRGIPQGPWAYCQSAKPDPAEKNFHPVVTEWIPVEHPALGTLLVFGGVGRHQNCRAFRWGASSSLGSDLATVTLSPKDLSLLRDLPQAKLRQKIAQLSLGGMKP